MKISSDDRAILDSVSEDDRVFQTATGHLCKQGWFSRLVNWILGAKPDFEAQQKAVAYAKERIVTDQTKNPRELDSLVTRLSSAFLLSEYQQKEIIREWEKKEGYNPLKEEVVTVQERNVDPEFPSALKHPPILTQSTGGTYFLKNRSGEIVAVFKPHDEEAYMPNNPQGLKKGGVFMEGHVKGTGYLKEIAAFELDVGGFVGVPHTFEVTLPFLQNGNVVMKKGSCQRFVKGKNLEKMRENNVSAIPSAEIQKIALFDMLCGNGDRTTSNLLYDSDSSRLIPIDHTFMFLDCYDWRGKIEAYPYKFSWLHFPQLEQPLSPDIRSWILNYPIVAFEKLPTEGGKRGCQLRLIFLQECVKRGLSMAVMRDFLSLVRGGSTSFDRLVLDTAESFKDQTIDDRQFLTRFHNDLKKQLDSLKGGNEPHRRG